MPVPAHQARLTGMNSITADHQILSLVDRWAAAELAGDADAVAARLTADFTGIGPVGFVLNREQWAARHRGDVDNREFRVTEPAVRVHGDVAIIVATLTQETTARGRDTSAAFRIGIVARREPDWRIAHVQLSGPLIAPGELPGFAR
jgi:ketosteroid isomerase-like protein